MCHAYFWAAFAERGSNAEREALPRVSDSATMDVACLRTAGSGAEKSLS